MPTCGRLPGQRRAPGAGRRPDRGRAMAGRKGAACCRCRRPTTRPVPRTPSSRIRTARWFSRPTATRCPPSTWATALVLRAYVFRIEILAQDAVIASHRALPGPRAGRPGPAALPQVAGAAARRFRARHPDAALAGAVARRLRTTVAATAGRLARRPRLTRVPGHSQAAPGSPGRPGRAGHPGRFGAGGRPFGRRRAVPAPTGERRRSHRWRSI